MSFPKPLSKIIPPRDWEKRMKWASENTALAIMWWYIIMTLFFTIILVVFYMIPVLFSFLLSAGLMITVGLPMQFFWQKKQKKNKADDQHV